MTKRTWLVGLAAASIAAFSIVRVRAELRSQASDIEQLRAQVATDRVEPSATPAQTTIVNIVAPSAAPSVPSAPSEREGALEQDEKQVDARAAAQKTACEQSFRSESIDAHWTSTTQPKLAADLRDRLSSRTSVRALECKSTTCRLEMSSADVTAFRADLQTILITHPIWSGPTFTTVTETLASGEVISVAYLVRNGNLLPTAF